MNFKEVQEKWQKRWGKEKLFEVKLNSKKKKYYVLEMFPYPSASFVHMGHVRNYTIGDIIARYKRMCGFNVLYPMGYDSFGLPAENAAKKKGEHPKKYTEKAIEKIIEYQKKLGNSYDWSKTLATHEPEYYKWNQYFFIKFFEKGLVYRKMAPVNWCPKCDTVLANEEVVAGECWRCDSTVEEKKLEQWFFKTTEYAEELLKDIEKLEWNDRIKSLQRNWIGKSFGTEILFEINGEKWPIFTTRIDTIFGVTFMVVSVQHPNLMELVTQENKKIVEEFVKKCKKAKSEELESLDKEGVFTGSYAINSITKERVPVWVGNFVVVDYGSGMVMAVPTHDQRDFEFAKKYQIPLKVVIQPKNKLLKENEMKEAYTEDGILVNSKEFSGLESKKAIEKITKFLEKEKLGKKTVNYKMRDWLISRQRYWGTPIPMIYCEKCGVVPEKKLPVLLPEDVSFGKTGNPILTSKSFQNVKCPKCKIKARRETDTMGGFMDSSWYFLRYTDNLNEKKAFEKKKVDYWMPVDQYIGGIEHAVGHLIYSRFFTKVLRDLGYLNFNEPFLKLFNQGIVNKDGRRMSKSYGNIVTQDEISEKYGIDTARIFLMFIADPESNMEWSDAGVEGVFKFVNRVLALKVNDKSNEKLEHYRNKFVKEITKNIEKFKFNLALIKLMKWEEILGQSSDAKSYEDFLRIFSVFAPHIAEELWEKHGKKNFISIETWPKFDEKKINEKIEFAERMIENLVEDVNQVQKLAKIEKLNKIKFIVAMEWKYSFMRKFKEKIEETRDISVLIKNLMDKEHTKEVANLVPALLKNSSKIPLLVLTQKEEVKVFKNSKKMFEERFGCKVEIEVAEKSKEIKVVNAMPGKPAVVVA